MKILIKYILLVLFSSAFLASCVDDEKIRFELDDAEKIANMRIEMVPEFSFLDVSNISNSKLAWTVYSDNTNIDRVELILQYYSLAADSLGDKTVWITYTQSDFGSDGIIDDERTSQDLAAFLGIGVDNFSGGDRFNITQRTYLTNGLVYPDTVLTGTEFQNVNISTTILGSSATTSFTTAFTVYVGCPFVANDAVGTYQVVADGWSDWAPGEEIEVVANDDGTGVVVKGMYSKFRSDNRGPYDVEILVDAGNGIATVAKQPAWEYFWYVGSEGYGTGSVEGGGFVFSCSGLITLTLTHTVTAGSFGSYPLTLQKIN